MEPLSELDAIKEKLLEWDVLGSVFPEDPHSDTVTWCKFQNEEQDLQLSLDVSFIRPLKSMDRAEKSSMPFTQSNSSIAVSRWVTFYSSQLSNILVGSTSIVPRQGLEEEDPAFTIKAYLLAVRRPNRIVGLSQIIQGKPPRIVGKEKLTELIGLKISKPIKVQQKKECVYHIVICAVQKQTTIIGLTLSESILLKSRDKSHQEKGLDTRFFQPGDLFKKFSQKKRRGRNVSITNSLQGLNDYFTSPNIRHKIINPFFLSFRFFKAVTLYLSKAEFPTTMTITDKIRKIFSEFGAVRSSDSSYSLAVVILPSKLLDDYRNILRPTYKLSKAFDQAINSKCLFLRNNSDPQWQAMEELFYPLEISSNSPKSKLFKEYVYVYNRQSGDQQTESIFQSEGNPDQIDGQQKYHQKGSKCFSKVCILINPRNNNMSNPLNFYFPSGNTQMQRPLLKVPALRKETVSEAAVALPREQDLLVQHSDSTKKTKNNLDNEDRASSSYGKERHTSQTSICQNMRGSQKSLSKHVKVASQIKVEDKFEQSEQTKMQEDKSQKEQQQPAETIHNQSKNGVAWMKYEEKQYFQGIQRYDSRCGLQQGMQIQNQPQYFYHPFAGQIYPFYDQTQQYQPFINQQQHFGFDMMNRLERQTTMRTDFNLPSQQQQMVFPNNNNTTTYYNPLLATLLEQNRHQQNPQNFPQ